MRKINWGILGPGKIASKFATTLNRLEDAKIHAVASRSIDKARNFADQYGISKAYGSYDEMLDDPDLDVVYIATPHTFHFKQTIMCLNKGIPVLCEKPITINSLQLKILTDLAIRNKTFMMQALWTRFLPSISTTLETIKSGKIGPIKVIEADFGFKADYDPYSRLFNPELGGGSLLDIGIYPLFLSLLLKGYPDTISAVDVKSSTGTDESVAISLGYRDGAIASLFCTFAANTGTKASIFCENGQIHLNNRWFAPASMQIKFNGEDPEDIDFDFTSKTGYEGEATEVMRCINQGLIESPMLSHDFSMKLMKLLDEIRKICKIYYPNLEEQTL